MVTYQEGQWRGQRLSCTRRRRCPDCDLVSKLLCHLRAWPLDPPPVAAPAGHRRRPTARRIRKGGCGDGNVQREGEDGADTTHDGDGANGQVNDTAADGAQSQLMVAPDEVGGRGASTYKMSESSMAAVARRLVERNTGMAARRSAARGAAEGVNYADGDAPRGGGPGSCFLSFSGRGWEWRMTTGVACRG